MEEKEKQKKFGNDIELIKEIAEKFRSEEQARIIGIVERIVEHLRKAGKYDVKLANDASLNKYDVGWKTAIDYFEHDVLKEIKK